MMLFSFEAVRVTLQPMAEDSWQAPDDVIFHKLNLINGYITKTLSIDHSLPHHLGTLSGWVR